MPDFYCTIEQITDSRLPLSMLIQYTDDEAMAPAQLPEIEVGKTLDAYLTEINPSIVRRIDAIRTGVNSIVDEHLRGNYVLPITGTIPNIISTIATDLVSVELVRRRIPELPESYKSLEKNRLDILLRIQKGDLDLLIPKIISTSGESGARIVKSDDQVFTDEMFGRMP